MTIRDIQKSYEDEASILGDYQSMSKTELANKCCDEEEAAWACREAGNEEEAHIHEIMRSAYYAALSLRYWYKIWEWRENSKSLMLDTSEFVEWLEWTLWDAFYYRLWRWEYKAVVKDGHFIKWKLDENGNKIPNPYYWVNDSNAPDKIIQRCSASARGYFYQYYNKDKRKADVHTYSLDSMIDEDGDYAVNWTGCITEDKHKYNDGAYLLISALFQKNELIEGLIIDGMVNGDSFKETKSIHTEEIWDDNLKEYVEQEIERKAEQFDPRKLVKHLSHLDENYIYQFCTSYDIPESAGKLLYDKLKATPNQKLYNLIKKVQIEVQTTPELVSLITSK